MAESEKQKPPKGGRKGGTYFPKIDLKKAVEYNKKLVSKTHTSPQPESVILPGVFNNNGPDGVVRASALRQYGLLNEDKTKMGALELGKEIASAPPEELNPLLQKACLRPKVFKQLYDTFKGDTINSAKLKQQAIKLKVHPDSADDCVQIFTRSLEYAGLGQTQGDGFLIHNNPIASDKSDEESDEDEQNENEKIDTKDPSSEKNDESNEPMTPLKRGNSAVQVNISLDSTMDTEKLEKLLKLLKSYGAI